MTCRHNKGDPNCSSTVGGYEYQRIERERTESSEKKYKKLLQRTPNPEQFDIVRHMQVGKNLVLMVQYSSCSACSFDSKKVMVFLNQSLSDVLYWRKIDPHFSETPPKTKKESPSPDTRMPANEIGWNRAVEFAKFYNKEQS